MNRHCVSWTFNDRQLQSISKFCGYYCVYFCVRRSRGVDMRKIVRSFTNVTGLNDVLVHAYVCSRNKKHVFSLNVLYLHHNRQILVSQKLNGWQSRHCNATSGSR